MSKHSKVEEKEIEDEDQKIRHRVKCKVCGKSITTDLDPKTFKDFKCAKCGSVGKFEFKIVVKRLKKLPRDLNIDEVFSMFKKAKRHPRDYKILNTLFYIGLRNTEMRTLKAEHIDLNRLILKVFRGKGKKQRLIPIIEINPFLEDYKEKSIYEKLESWIKESKTGYIFEGRSALGIISDRHLRRIVKKYARLAKITNWEEIHPHTLRDSYATHLRAGLGVPLDVIQKVLGHVRIDTTLIYAHMSIEGCREEILKAVRIAQLKKECMDLLEKIKTVKTRDKKIDLMLELLLKQSMINLGITH